MTYETHESAREALEKMNGKEVQGRYIKVDFDTKAAPKSSYRVKTDTDGNRLYNRDTIKNEKSKRIKKEKERSKQEKSKGFRKPMM